MQIDIISLFPEMFVGPFSESLLKKAQEKRLLQINIHQLRNFTHDKHNQVDDTLFGGGTGMVLKPEPIFEAVEKVRKNKKTRVVLISPQGSKFSHKKALELLAQQ
jgi:tRNA (guanine37-N1)-methyltransferase